jgi:hypothetical protein
LGGLETGNGEEREIMWAEREGLFKIRWRESESGLGSGEDVRRRTTTARWAPRVRKRYLREAREQIGRG